MDSVVIFHLKFILSHIPVLIFALCYLKAFYGILRLLGKSQVDLGVLIVSW